MERHGELNRRPPDYELKPCEGHDIFAYVNLIGLLYLYFVIFFLFLPNVAYFRAIFTHRKRCNIQ